MDNIENKILGKLKDEIKSEISDEILAEIKNIVKEEVRSVLITERGLETTLTAYIKSLCYDEVHYLRMLNRGLVKHGSTLIEIPNTSRNIVWLTKRKNIDIRNLYEEYRSGNFIFCSYEDFNMVLDFKVPSKPISWNDKGRKQFSYKRLFELYNSVYVLDFSKSTRLKNKFLYFLADCFYFDGEFKKFVNIKKAFDKAYPIE